MCIYQIFRNILRFHKHGRDKWLAFLSALCCPHILQHQHRISLRFSPHVCGS
nr:MAG TPA: hypothetical protein [Caudoviricetes sp.]